jgi:hypothetical protein
VTPPPPVLHASLSTSVRPLFEKEFVRILVEIEKEFFFDNLLVRIHFIIVIIRWTGLAPWQFEFPLSR